MSSDPRPLADLAAFQKALLEILHQGGSPAEMRARILQAANSPELIAYAEQFEDRMVIVASELVRKWARRTPIDAR